MASGCILGKCIYCDKIIWEDEKKEIDFDNEMMMYYHVECKEIHNFVKKNAFKNKIAHLQEKR